ncbi:hypothetical protein GALMADRAFT_149002 [Galerina marginata CBS 339.88]|uniref:Uncharacterized protein n=1 Tax=Galerina marginata (strain CBS 339.88) TaxID=685588 RepID=A0A067S2P5_GALM3|nr:hypothetical protein GALMADRAFT_149002 [Galerina marginata CBS 339.88]
MVVVVVVPQDAGAALLLVLETPTSLPLPLHAPPLSFERQGGLPGIAYGQSNCSPERAKPDQQPSTALILPFNHHHPASLPSPPPQLLKKRYNDVNDTNELVRTRRHVASPPFNLRAVGRRLDRRERIRGVEEKTRGDPGCGRPNRYTVKRVYETRFTSFPLRRPLAYPLSQPRRLHPPGPRHCPHQSLPVDPHPRYRYPPRIESSSSSAACLRDNEQDASRTPAAVPLLVFWDPRMGRPSSSTSTCCCLRSFLTHHLPSTRFRVVAGSTCHYPHCRMPQTALFKPTTNEWGVREPWARSSSPVLLLVGCRWCGLTGEHQPLALLPSRAGARGADCERRRWDEPHRSSCYSNLSSTSSSLRDPPNFRFPSPKSHPPSHPILPTPPTPSQLAIPTAFDSFPPQTKTPRDGGTYGITTAAAAGSYRWRLCSSMNQPWGIANSS